MTKLTDLGARWMEASCPEKYSYGFTWMGRPIIQYPQDLIVMQELIWSVRPDLIIETGIARGGSLVYYASLLNLLDLNIQPCKRRVVGIDVEIREENLKALDQHPMRRNIAMLQGSSVDPKIVATVIAMARSHRTTMVLLDSLHTHDHVLAELEAYAPLVSVGSYLVVFDTIVEQLPSEFWKDRPWCRGNNPATAVKQFLATTDAFQVDTAIDAKLGGISVAPGGYLKRVK